MLVKDCPDEGALLFLAWCSHGATAGRPYTSSHLADDQNALASS